MTHGHGHGGEPLTPVEEHLAEILAATDEDVRKRLRVFKESLAEGLKL